MKRIGIIVAIETDSLFAHYGKLEKLPCPSGFNLYILHKPNCDLYVLHTGVGEVAAAAGTQYLISECKVEMVVNFGVVGGLTQTMEKQRLCVVQRVVHYRFDATKYLPVAVGQVPPHEDVYIYTDKNLVNQALILNSELCPATCASGDWFVDSAEDKRQIHADFAADICDMEAAGIVLTCEANDVPCLMLKAVADSLAGGGKEFWKELQSAALVCLQTADKIIEGLT